MFFFLFLFFFFPIVKTNNRNRAEELRSENPLLDRIDEAMDSIGWGLGASDHRQHYYNSATMVATPAEDGDICDGGVAGSPTSVLASYFLKSHGGAHAIQCLCSILASSAALATLVLPSKRNDMRLVLMRRTMVFAMVKHVTGLLGGALVAARGIPEVGLKKTRLWMQQLAKDPVSQYVFYAACVLLWLPSSAATAQQSIAFSKKFSWLPLVLVGPILLREAVSTLLVISDVLVLWATSTADGRNALEGEEESNASAEDTIHTVLSVSQKSIDIVMSLLVTPSRWRPADPATRQALLAKLTSRVSLALELIVGAVMTLDAMGRMGQFVFGTTTTVGSHKPTFFSVVKRLVCATIYLQFLYSRKRKISRLATAMRGGSARLPFYVLDVLLDPPGAMGLQPPQAQRQAQKQTQPQTPQEQQGPRDLSWKDYVLIALGMDE